MVLGLKPLTHFEFILVCGVRKWSRFIRLHVSVHFAQHYLLKRVPFLHCIFSSVSSLISEISADPKRPRGELRLLLVFPAGGN